MTNERLHHEVFVSKFHLRKCACHRFTVSLMRYIVSVTWKEIAPGSLTFHADSLLRSKKQAVGPYPEQNGS